MMERAKTAQEQLAAWDAGDTVWSIEMGGLGPGYEQAIQVLAIEIMRDNIGKPLPEQGTWSNWGDETVSRIDYRRPDGTYSMGGFSGAMVGAAKHIAYRFLKEGPATALANCPADRLIQVSRSFPEAPRA